MLVLFFFYLLFYFKGGVKKLKKVVFILSLSESGETHESIKTIIIVSLSIKEGTGPLVLHLGIGFIIKIKEVLKTGKSVGIERISGDERLIVGRKLGCVCIG